MAAAQACGQLAAAEHARSQMAAEVARRRGEGQKLRKEAAAVIGALEAALNKVRVRVWVRVRVRP